MSGRLFYGRPEVPQLDLDVDGSTVRTFFGIPTRSTGSLTDGSPFATRYRGGWLHVYVGQPGAADTSREDEVWCAPVGPPFHAAITFEQVCDITGITIDGRPVEATDVLPPKGERCIDLSGGSRLFNGVARGTRRSMAALAEAILDRFPEARPFECDWVMDGDRPTATTLRAVDTFDSGEQGVTIAFGLEAPYPRSIPYEGGGYSPSAAWLERHSDQVVRLSGSFLPPDVYDHQFGPVAAAAAVPVRWTVVTFVFVETTVPVTHRAGMERQDIIGGIIEEVWPNCVSQNFAVGDSLPGGADRRNALCGSLWHGRHRMVRARSRQFRLSVSGRGNGHGPGHQGLCPRS